MQRRTEYVLEVLGVQGCTERYREARWEPQGDAGDYIEVRGVQRGTERHRESQGDSGRLTREQRGIAGEEEGRRGSYRIRGR